MNFILRPILQFLNLILILKMRTTKLDHQIRQPKTQFSYLILSIKMHMIKRIHLI